MSGITGLVLCFDFRILSCSPSTKPGYGNNSFPFPFLMLNRFIRPLRSNNSFQKFCVEQHPNSSVRLPPTPFPLHFLPVIGHLTIFQLLYPNLAEGRSHVMSRSRKDYMSKVVHDLVRERRRRRSTSPEEARQGLNRGAKAWAESCKMSRCSLSRQNSAGDIQSGGNGIYGRSAMKQ